MGAESFGIRKEHQDALASLLENWLHAVNSSVEEDSGRLARECSQLSAQVVELRTQSGELSNESARLSEQCAALQLSLAHVTEERAALSEQAANLHGLVRQLEEKVGCLEREKAAAVYSSEREQRLEASLRALKKKFKEKSQALDKYRTYVQNSNGLATVYHLASHSTGNGAGASDVRAIKKSDASTPSFTSIAVQTEDTPVPNVREGPSRDQQQQAHHLCFAIQKDNCGAPCSEAVCAGRGDAAATGHADAITPTLPESRRDIAADLPCKRTAWSNAIAEQLRLDGCHTPNLRRTRSDVQLAVSLDADPLPSQVTVCDTELAEEGKEDQVARVVESGPAACNGSPDGQVTIWDTDCPGMLTQSSATSAKRAKRSIAVEAPDHKAIKDMHSPAAKHCAASFGAPNSGAAGPVTNKTRKVGATRSPRWRTKIRKRRGATPDGGHDDVPHPSAVNGNPEPAKSLGQTEMPGTRGIAVEAAKVNEHLPSDNRSQDGTAAGGPQVANTLGASAEPVRVEEPNSSKQQIKYAEVVRGKDKRALLPGHSCADCLKFYQALASWGHECVAEAPRCGHAVNRNPSAAVGLQQELSRHRHKFKPPETPEGFWDMGFMDSLDSRAECYKYDDPP